MSDAEAAIVIYLTFYRPDFQSKLKSKVFRPRVFELKISKPRT
jgi:hypothetical protein